MSRASRGGGDPDEPGSWLDPAEAGSQLLLFADEVEPVLEAALAGGAVAGLVAAPTALTTWRPLARRHGVALLARGGPVADADGCHLPAPAGVAAARAELGGERIIGAACGLSRHAAMLAGEAGADYVMFGDLDRVPATGDELVELVAWWNQLFVIPCAAAGRLDPASARALVAAGADLLAVRRPAAGVVEALAEAGTPLPH